MLKEMAVAFFTNLYTNDNSTISRFSMAEDFSLVDHADYVSLAKPFICDEVKQALFQMILNKVLGLVVSKLGFMKTCGMW